MHIGSDTNCDIRMCADITVESQSHNGLPIVISVNVYSGVDWHSHKCLTWYHTIHCRTHQTFYIYPKLQLIDKFLTIIVVNIHRIVWVSILVPADAAVSLKSKDKEKKK